MCRVEEQLDDRALWNDGARFRLGSMDELGPDERIWLWRDVELQVERVERRRDGLERLTDVVVEDPRGRHLALLREALVQQHATRNECDECDERGERIPARTRIAVLVVPRFG